MARYVRRSSGLTRPFGWFDVLLMTIAAPTGSGVLFYAAQGSRQPGGSLVVAFLVGAVLFLPTVVTASALVGAFPRSGGPFVAVARLVHPAMAWLGGAMLVLGDAIIVGVLGVIAMEIGGSILVTMGRITTSPTVTSAGAALQGRPGAIIGGILWVGLFWRLMLANPRYFRAILGSLVLVPIGAAFLAGVLLFAGDATSGQAGFDSLWGAGTSAQIVVAAQAHGWAPPTFNWNATFGLLLVVIWAFNGTELAAYVAGEVRTPRSSYWRGLLSGWLVVGGLYMFLAAALEHRFGPLIGPYDYLYQNHRPALDAIMTSSAPSIPFYELAVVRNPVLGVLVVAPFLLLFAKIVPVAFLTTSRLIFGMAMDRILPEAMTRVDPRTTAPTAATHLTAFIALGGVGLYFAGVGVVLGSLMFLTMFSSWTFGLAAIRLGIKCPELLPGRWTEVRLFRVRAIVWLGVLATASGALLLALTLRDLNAAALGFLALVIVLLLLYFALRTRALKREAIALTGDSAPDDLLPPD